MQKKSTKNRRKMRDREGYPNFIDREEDERRSDETKQGEGRQISLEKQSQGGCGESRGCSNPIGNENPWDFLSLGFSQNPPIHLCFLREQTNWSSKPNGDATNQLTFCPIHSLGIALPLAMNYPPPAHAFSFR